MSNSFLTIELGIYHSKLLGLLLLTRSVFPKQLPGQVGVNELPLGLKYPLFNSLRLTPIKRTKVFMTVSCELSAQSIRSNKEVQSKQEPK